MNELMKELKASFGRGMYYAYPDGGIPIRQKTEMIKLFLMGAMTTIAMITTKDETLEFIKLIAPIMESAWVPGDDW